MSVATTLQGSGNMRGIRQPIVTRLPDHPDGLKPVTSLQQAQGLALDLGRQGQPTPSLRISLLDSPLQVALNPGLPHRFRPPAKSEHHTSLMLVAEG
ncbi:hypothetical protein [Streptomyces sp. NBC_00154]|uniref:hypothetical protein n=1 Tax=Streptomyces sp. NBC_00154 TaxID=2975670 RepID=UPI00224E7DED|nr:hypothetical protein [Streptomyces sp. NBC_00154]MCX5312112.1 hypothetical protein [Streptomyces sp. NBC_00154]